MANGTTTAVFDNQGSGSGGQFTFMQAGATRMTIDSSGNTAFTGDVTINSETLKISGNFPQLFFEDTAGSDLDAYIVNLSLIHI